MTKALLSALFTVLTVVSARQNATAKAHSLSVPTSPGFLKIFMQKSDPCACAHKGRCSCEGALKFMSCISDSCSSDECKCMHDGRNHFKEACENMASGCPDLGMECADDSATCDGDSIGYAQGYAQDVRQEDQQQEEAESATDQQQQTQKEEAETATDQQQQTDENSEGLGEQLGGNAGGGPKKKLKYGGHRYVSRDRHKDKVKKLHNHEHHIFAKGIIVTIVVMSIAIGLGSSSNFTIVKHTWNTMDMVVTTFLALAWFYVTMHLLEFHGLQGWWKVFMHMSIAILLLLVSSVVTFAMKANSGNDRGMIIFNTIYNSILLWCFAGFVSNVQQQYKHSTVFVLVATLGLMVFYAGLALFWYYVLGRFFKDKETSSGSINTLTGAALAAGTVLWVHMLIAGGYHTVEHPRPTKPSFNETLFMNAFSFVWIGVALKGVPLVQALSDGCKPNPSSGQYDTKTYWKKRAFDSLGVFVGFLPFYSCVLSLGHLIVDNLGYNETEIEARLYLSVVSTLIGVGLIVMCAKVPQLAGDDLLSGTLIGLGGFMTGSAWANLLNNSINMMTHGYQHPFKMKFYITCFLTAVVFPVYFYAFKPMVEKMTTPPKTVS